MSGGAANDDGGLTRRQRLAALERDCDVEFTRAGGPGGQHRNTTDSAVRLTHRPTGIVVVASERRSQARNRRLALERLAERLDELVEKRRRRRRARNRRTTRPSRAARERRLQSKKRRGRKKELRRRVRPPAADD